MVEGWRLVAPLLAAGDRDAAGPALARAWRRTSDDNAKYLRDFQKMVDAWELIDGLAFIAHDGDQLRAALTTRGIVLEKTWLYEPIVLGLLDSPTPEDETP